MNDIYYVNSAGVKLNLLEPPYMLQTGELFDYEWAYDYSSTSMNGGKINHFYKNIKSLPLTLSVINYGKDNYYAAIDKFYETTEYDVYNETPGKLYFGEYYLSCYLTASNKTNWESDSSLLDNDIVLTAEYAYWIREKKFSFFQNGSGSLKREGLKYPYEYPYEYAAQESMQYLTNDHFTDSGFVMIFFGPVVNPGVRIAGHLYEIETLIYENEYIVIDTRTKTAKKILATGEEKSLFNSRNKKNDLWQKIPPGKVPIIWPGTFGIDITLLQERGEPGWNS